MVFLIGKYIAKNETHYRIQLYTYPKYKNVKELVLERDNIKRIYEFNNYQNIRSALLEVDQYRGLKPWIRTETLQILNDKLEVTINTAQTNGMIEITELNGYTIPTLLVELPSKHLPVIKQGKCRISYFLSLTYDKEIRNLITMLMYLLDKIAEDPNKHGYLLRGMNRCDFCLHPCQESTLDSSNFYGHLGCLPQNKEAIEIINVRHQLQVDVVNISVWKIVDLTERNYFSPKQLEEILYIIFKYHLGSISSAELVKLNNFYNLLDCVPRGKNGDTPSYKRTNEIRRRLVELALAINLCMSILSEGNKKQFLIYNNRKMMNDGIYFDTIIFKTLNIRFLENYIVFHQYQAALNSAPRKIKSNYWL